MADKIRNLHLQRWREQHKLTRNQLAQLINQSKSGIAGRLACDEERIRRWEVGEVAWPRNPYPAALEEVTGLRREALGFGRSKTPAVLPVSAAPLIRDTPPEIDEIADIADRLNQGSRHAVVIEEIEQAAASMAGAHTEVPPKNLICHVTRVHRQVRDLLNQGDLRFRHVRDLLRIDAEPESPTRHYVRPPSPTRQQPQETGPPSPPGHRSESPQASPTCSKTT